MPKKSVKEEMLKVASRQFYHQGYTATSVKDIVEECGTTAPALYHHFGSKQALALAYLESCAREQAERWQPIFSKESLSEIIDAWIAEVRKDARKKDYFGCPIGNFSSQLDISKNSEADQAMLRKKLGEIMDSWITGMSRRFDQLKAESQLSDSIDTTDLAIQLLTVYEGGLLVWRATRRGEVIDSLERQLNAISRQARYGE